MRFQRSKSIEGRLHSSGLEARLDIRAEECGRGKQLTSSGSRERERERLHSPDAKYIPRSHAPIPTSSSHTLSLQLIPSVVNSLIMLELSESNHFSSEPSYIVSHVSFWGTPHIQTTKGGRRRGRGETLGSHTDRIMSLYCVDV